MQNTYVFVLALLAVVNVALALTIYALARRVRVLESWRSTIVSLQKTSAAHTAKLAELANTREARSNAAILARVEDLAAAVEGHTATFRKFQQRVHGWIGAAKSAELAAAANGAVDEADDDVAAMLALQTAPPSAPGGR